MVVFGIGFVVLIAAVVFGAVLVELWSYLSHCLGVWLCLFQSRYEKENNNNNSNIENNKHKQRRKQENINGGGLGGSTRSPQDNRIIVIR